MSQVYWTYPHFSPLSPFLASNDELAAEIAVDPRRLSDFWAGDAELPSAALDRLLDVLGLRLMQEIPR